MILSTQPSNKPKKDKLNWEQHLAREMPDEKDLVNLHRPQPVVTHKKVAGRSSMKISKDPVQVQKIYPSRVYPEPEPRIVQVNQAKPPTKLSFNQLKPKKTLSADSDLQPDNAATVIKTKKQLKVTPSPVGPKPTTSQASQPLVTNIINNNNINNYFIQPSVGKPTTAAQIVSPQQKHTVKKVSSKRAGSARPIKEANTQPLPPSTAYTSKRRESPMTKISGKPPVRTNNSFSKVVAEGASAVQLQIPQATISLKTKKPVTKTGPVRAMIPSGSRETPLSKAVAREPKISLAPGSSKRPSSSKPIPPKNEDQGLAFAKKVV